MVGGFAVSPLRFKHPADFALAAVVWLEWDECPPDIRLLTAPHRYSAPVAGLGAYKE